METEKSRFAALRDALVPRGTAPSGARRELASGGRVLFALSASDLRSEGLHTALAIAELFESELHVLCVLPAFDGINPLAPRMDDLLRAVDRRLEVEHATRVWLEAGLGFTLAEQRLALRYGDPGPEIAAHTQDLDANVVVITSNMVGQSVTALARAAGVPVLVARARALAGAIVAASDLQDGAFPVLRTAAELGRRLKAPVVAIHNVDAPTPRMDSGSPRLSQLSDACARRLREASRRLEIDPDVVVSHEFNSAEAILREARMRDQPWTFSNSSSATSWMASTLSTAFR